MNSLRTLLDSGTPLVAVSFDDSDSEGSAAAAESAGVDVAELCVDRYERYDAAHVRAQIEAYRPLPVLATIRSAAEGGNWHGPEAERLALYRAVVPVVDAVDVELSSTGIVAEVVAAAHANDTLAVVSHHDFARTPGTDELRAVVAAATELGADLVKVSTMAHSAADVRRLATLLTDAAAGPAGPELIVIAMGETGTLSRVFFPALGSRLTYSFLDGFSAPGQLQFHETRRLLRQFYPDYARNTTAAPHGN